MVKTNPDELRIKKYEHYGFDCSVPLMGQEFEFKFYRYD
jgi:metallo-beta-lactamase family protein